MIPPVSIDRYVGEHELLAKLADWLRAGRANLYADMVAKGHISANDAYRDEVARASIAADWHCIATGEPRNDVVAAPRRWCVWALEQALAGQEVRLSRKAEVDIDFPDHVDLRDAIACLLQEYRSRWTGVLLLEAHDRISSAVQREAA